MGFFFFKTPAHRVFNYQPIYYDERKEAIKEKIENAEKRARGEYVPGETIKKGFKNMRYESKRSSANNLTKLISLIAIVIFLIAIIYFTNGISLFLN